MQTTKSVRDFSLVIALVVICAFFAIVSPRFLSARNLSLLTTELSITATLAMGMLLVILPGNIDLSAGSGVGLLGGIASVLVFEHNWPAPLAMGAALLTGIFIWFCMGNLIVRQRIPAFIITLGGLLIFKGLFWLVIHNSTIPIVQGGRANLYAIGGNEEAAVISGVPVEKVVVGSFTIMGAIVAIAGFMQTSYSGASTTTVGDLMELDAIAACVIGGVGLRGGRGTVLGVLFGALIMACLLNGMTLLAVSPEFKFIARGTVLSLAVWMDVRLGR